MTSVLDHISRVMMTAVSYMTTRRPKDSDIRRWAEVEYKGDPYAYYFLMNGIKPKPKDF